MNIVKITLAITVFTCFTSSCFGNDTHYNDLHKSDNSVTLHLIDLSACPAIIDILDDVLSEKDSIKRDNARYYLINLSPQGKGINAYITEHTHENLPNVGDFIGYALWGKHNDLIVINWIDTDITLFAKVLDMWGLYVNFAAENLTEYEKGCNILPCFYHGSGLHFTDC